MYPDTEFRPGAEYVWLVLGLLQALVTWLVDLLTWPLAVFG